MLARDEWSHPRPPPNGSWLSACSHVGAAAGRVRVLERQHPVLESTGLPAASGQASAHMRDAVVPVPSPSNARSWWLTSRYGCPVVAVMAQRPVVVGGVPREPPVRLQPARRQHPTRQHQPTAGAERQARTRQSLLQPPTGEAILLPMRRAAFWLTDASCVMSARLALWGRGWWCWAST